MHTDFQYWPLGGLSLDILVLIIASPDGLTGLTGEAERLSTKSQTIA